jgi:hypothetical protein
VNKKGFLGALRPGERAEALYRTHRPAVYPFGVRGAMSQKGIVTLNNHRANQRLRPAVDTDSCHSYTTSACLRKSNVTMPAPPRRPTQRCPHNPGRAQTRTCSTAPESTGSGAFVISICVRSGRRLSANVQCPPTAANSRSHRYRLFGADSGRSRTAGVDRGRGKTHRTTRAARCVFPAMTVETPVDRLARAA